MGLQVAFLGLVDQPVSQAARISVRIELFGMINVAGVISAVDVKPGAWIQIAKGEQSLLLFPRQCSELAFMVTAINTLIESPDHGAFRNELVGE
jgi:hypothetical protein